MTFRTLELIRPFVPFLPEVVSPGRDINLQEKFVWTTIALLIYLVASQIPLYGIKNAGSEDPFSWMRMMMASNRGTLMDLGISPVITSGMVIQFLTSSGIMKVNHSIKEDRLLYDAFSKFLSLAVTVGQAIGQVTMGFYGPTNVLGLRNSCLLFVQLLFSGIIIILLDELLQKGYGIGNGVNLFIATNVCETILWNTFSPKAFSTARGVEFEGSLVALFHLLVVRKNKFQALYEAFFRQNLPNCSSLLSTILLFAFVIYLQGLRVELPTESTQVKGRFGKLPIKLLYASTTPVIAQSYIISHISTASRLLFNWFPENIIVRLLGVWEISKNGRYIPKRGLCFFLFPPENILDVFRYPVSSFVYILICLLTAALLSRAWIEMGDKSEYDVARQLKSNKMTIRGVSEKNLPTYLSRYIPTAAFLGGLLTGLVVLSSNIFGAMGSGTNIFLAVSIVWQYLELMTKEQIKKSGLSFIG